MLDFRSLRNISKGEKSFFNYDFYVKKFQSMYLCFTGIFQKVNKCFFEQLTIVIDVGIVLCDEFKIKYPMQFS